VSVKKNKKNKIGFGLVTEACNTSFLGEDPEFEVEITFVCSLYSPVSGKAEQLQRRD